MGLLGTWRDRRQALRVGRNILESTRQADAAFAAGRTRTLDDILRDMVDDAAVERAWRVYLDAGRGKPGMRAALIASLLEDDEDQPSSQ